jgi:hypothetical protein
MAQHDMNIANQGFPAFRADLNSALTAIANNSSGATAPSTTFAYQWWYDTSTNALKMRNADNDAWIEIGTFNQTTDSFTPSGVTSDSISEGDSSVEVVDSGTGYVAVIVDGVETARFSSGGDISFYEDTGTTAKFFWDASAESLSVPTLLTTAGINAAKTASTYNVVASFSSQAGTSKLRIDDNSNNSATTRMYITHNFSRDGAGFAADNSGVGVSAITFDNGTIGLNTASAGNNNSVERMRIDSSGNLLVGKTSDDLSTPGFSVSRQSGTTNGMSIIKGGGSWGTNVFIGRTSGAGTGAYTEFWYNGTTTGTITTNGTTTSYNTSSDYRLKEDWQPVANASDRVAQLKPVNFAWIASGERVDGFLAHELAEVIPEAVTGTKDGMRTEEYEVSPAVYEDVIIPAEYDEEGNLIAEERTEQQLVTEAVMGIREVPDYQGIDQSKLVPLLTAALQDAIAKIEALEARVDALENA